MPFVSPLLLPLGIILVLGTLLPAQEKEPRKLAFLIGVSKYDRDGLNDLQYPEADVRALAAVLEKAGFVVHTLTGSEVDENRATRENLDKQFGVKQVGNQVELGSWMQSMSRLRKRDTALIVFTGHGVQRSVTRDGKSVEDAFFCPVDCSKNDPATLFSIGELVRLVGEHSGTSQNLIVIDACRDDPGKGAKTIDGSTMRALPSKISVLFGSSAGQQSFESKELGHGLLVHALLEGLSGKAALDGEVTWGLLASYAQRRVPAQARSLSLVQRPNVIMNLTDDPVLVRLNVIASNEPKPGEERAIEIAPGVKMIFCWIPPGEAQLGSPKAERDAVLNLLKEEKEPEWLAAEAEEIRGKYKSKGFWLGKYEVTQQEWAAVMDGKNPSRFKGERLPVESVSWNDCQEFLAILNVKAIFGTAGKFVLPHEDEWEYACRGGRGNLRAFYFGDELNGTQANCDGKYPFGTNVKGPYLGKTTNVGSFASKAPHPWGLCDMHGNVREWCENLYSIEHKKHILRGGSYSSRPEHCRAANQYRQAPEFSFFLVGVRVCFRLD